MDPLQEITQVLQHEVNCLSDDNRNTRKRALEKIHKRVLTECKTSSPAVMHGLLEFLLKPLLKLISDPVEKCRELCITFFSEYLPLMEDIGTLLPYLIPVVVARLGNPDLVEPSEEIRLSLVILLTSIVSMSTSEIAPYLGDFITILQRTIVDPYPEVKKESCTCTVKLAKVIPGIFFHQSESLAKPLLISMMHQHSKVRVASLKAMGATIRYGSPKPLDEGLTTLAQRACDPTPSVRTCLTDIVGEWLLDLPDRYSYHHKLVPLLFTCMSDEVKEIKNKAHNLWEQIGAKYQLENEEELKDKIDFMQVLDPAPFLEFPRPSLGCRVLVYRCFSKILPAILRDLTDWTAHSRIKSSQLLFTLLYHLEDRATHHVQAIINGLYKACQDEEQTVTDQAALCCNVLGYYVSPEVWCKLVLPAVRTSGGCRVGGTAQASTVAVGPVQCTSCLRVLVGLLHGSRPDTVQPQLQSIVDCLCEPEVGQSEHDLLLQELLEAVVVVSQRSLFDCPKFSLKLFTIILRVSASNHVQSLSKKVDEALLCLATAQNLGGGVLDLYFNHSRDVIQAFKETYKNWSVHSTDCYMFGSLLSGAGPILGQLLDDVIPILSYCLNAEEPELRLHFITLLIRLLVNASSTLNSENNFSSFASRVVIDIITPNLVWKAGREWESMASLPAPNVIVLSPVIRTAAAIRTAAMTCLQALLQVDGTSVELVDQLLPDILPKILSCLDDDTQSTRLVSCKVLRAIFLLKTRYFNVDKLHTLYGDLLKRLDDNSDDVRIATTQTLIAYIQAFPEDYDNSLYRAHTEALFKGFLLHLDDPSPHIQEAVFGVLSISIRLNSALMKEHVEAVKHKHRETRWCEKVLKQIDQLTEAL